MPESAPLQGVIFDMDGLLADTESVSFRATVALLEREYGVRDAGADDRWFAAIVGMSGRESWPLIAGHFALPVELPRDLPQLNATYGAYHEEALAAGVEPMPGAPELVRACRAAGLRLGLASSSRLAHIELVLAALGLRPFFDTLTSGQEVPASKPDPAIYRLALARLGVPAAGCVAIEDSGPGVAAAARAGLRCLAVPSAYTVAHDFSPASAIVPSLVGITPAALAALPS